MLHSLLHSDAGKSVTEIFSRLFFKQTAQIIWMKMQLLGNFAYRDILHVMVLQKIRHRRNNSISAVRLWQHFSLKRQRILLQLLSQMRFGCRLFTFGFNLIFRLSTNL
ncbi:hypothetical protein D3C77_516390 [compost metagenome]